MEDKAKELRNAYMKEYRARNKERLAEKRRADYKANPQKYIDRNKAYWERKVVKEC